MTRASLNLATNTTNVVLQHIVALDVGNIVHRRLIKPYAVQDDWPCNDARSSRDGQQNHDTGLRRYTEYETNTNTNREKSTRTKVIEHFRHASVAAVDGDFERQEVLEDVGVVAETHAGQVQRGTSGKPVA